MMKKTKKHFLIIWLTLLLSVFGAGFIAGCSSQEATDILFEVLEETTEEEPAETVTDVPTETVTDVPTETAEDIPSENTAEASVVKEVPSEKGSDKKEASEESMEEESTFTEASGISDSSAAASALPDPDGVYNSKDDVALYLYTYGELPQNYITKKEAKKLGWQGGSVEQVAPGKAIGGDYYGNYEGTLPDVSGEEYHECDIDTLGRKSRGAKRIIYSTDGRIYYTEDHYESFELLYGEEP